MPVTAQRSNQNGFSLVEIMIALVIGLVLTAGVIQVFQGSKMSYVTNEGLARLQESGRFAVDLLAREIRMAGYQGCRNRDQIEPRVIAQNPPAELDFANDKVLRGANNVGGGTTINGRAVAAGTDTLVVKKASTRAAQMDGNLDSVNANIQIHGNEPGFEQNDLIFITDCSDADVFRVTNTPGDSGTVTLAHGNGSNTDNRLSKPYKEDALVMAFESNTYFVSDSGNDNERGQDILSLYVDRVGAANPVELIRGVEDMQVLYGEDTDGDGSVDAYVTADAVSDFADVIATRIGLLINSVEAAMSQDDTATYDILDETIDPSDDRLMRKVFTITAAVRNRELRSDAFN